MYRPPNNETQYARMLHTPIPKLVVSLGLPTTASMLVSTLYNTADTYFVSQIGTSAAAAVGVVFALMSIIQAFGFGVGVGASSLISRKLGAREDDEACAVASSAVFLAMLFGVLLMICGLLALRPLMRLLGATPTILPYASDYARYILLGAPLMCSSYVFNNILRAEGEAMLSMIGLCTGVLLNIALDPLFIFVLDMGIAGAAVATILSQIVSFCILLSFFLGGKSVVPLRVSRVSRDILMYYHILKTGFPTICRQGLASFSTALLNGAAAVYGDAAVAAVTIANKIYLFVRSIVIGLGQGFQPVAGYNYGAKRYGRVREAFRFTVILGSVLCVVGGVLVAWKADTLIQWFRHDDADVVRIGTAALRYACLVMPVLAYSTFVNQLYQCLGFAVQATFLASCRQGVFFLPAILLLPRLLGLTGVEMTQPVADLCTFLISIPFHIAFYRKYLPKEPAIDAVSD